MRRNGKILCAALLSALVLTGAYTAVSAAGSSDPLVTLSYLTGRFAPEMRGEMQDLVSARETELVYRFDQALQSVGGGTSPSGQGSAVFSVVTLSKGQVLTGDVGCEVMLRVGSASCSSGGSTGLVDTTDGTTLGDGKALAVNHLYMVTISTRSVVAGADTVKLLVRGPYTVA